MGHKGMHFRTLFYLSIIFGGQIQMQTSVQPVCGPWYVIYVVFDLAA
jgi:hypothetical protein